MVEPTTQAATGMVPWGIMMFHVDSTNADTMIDSVTDACAYIEYVMSDMEHRLEIMLRYQIDGRTRYKTMPTFDPVEFQDCNANKVFSKYIKKVQRALFNRMRNNAVESMQIELRLPDSDFIANIDSLRVIADKMEAEGHSFEEYAMANPEQYIEQVRDAARENGFLKE